MTKISSAIKIGTREVKDYISIIQNAVELFELYSVNMQLEKLKRELIKKRGSNHDDVTIMAEINLASRLQEMCRRRV